MQYKLSDAVKESSKGVFIDIHVISQSKKTALGFNKWEPKVKIKVKSPPVKGKANEEIREFFKKLLGNCEITSGLLSPKKTLLIRDCCATEVAKKIEEKIVKDI